MSYSKNKVTSIQTLIQNFFLERLIQQRGVTSRTIESYRDTFKIYIKYLQEMFNISVENIDISDFSQDKVLLFLKYLEENSKAELKEQISGLSEFVAALKEPKQEKYDKAIDELCKNGGFLSGAGSGKFTTDFGDWLSLLVMESYDNIKKDYLDNSIARTAKYKVIVEFFKKYNWDIQAAGNKFRQKYNEYKATLPPPVEDDEEE